MESRHEPEPNRRQHLGVAAVGASDVQAVGYTEGKHSRTLAQRYNGSSWGIISGANPSTATGDIDRFFAVGHVPGTQRFFAVGTQGPDRPGNVGEHTLIERYC